MATESTIDMFRREDEKMSQMLQYIVPIQRGADDDNGQEKYGPASYESPGEPKSWDKMNYAQLLTGKTPNPVINITDDDIAMMKQKSYASVERDFNNYVGSLLKPNENPANKAFLQKIYPGWFDKQKDAVEKWHDTKKRVENLMIMGPRSEEDLFMLYRLGYTAGGIGTATNQMGQMSALQTQVRSRNAPGVGPGGAPWVGNAAAQQAKFQRGIFNIDRRVLQSKPLMGFPTSVFRSPPNLNWSDINMGTAVTYPNGGGFPAPRFTKPTTKAPTSRRVAPVDTAIASTSGPMFDESV